MPSISKITLPDGITYDIEASNIETNRVTSFYNMTKTAGHWSVSTYTAYKCGNVISLTMYIVGDGVNMSAGGTSFTGHLGGGYYPISPVRSILIPPTNSTFAFVNIEEDGSITIKVQLGTINLSSSNICAVNFTYVTDGILHIVS